MAVEKDHPLKDKWAESRRDNNHYTEEELMEMWADYEAENFDKCEVQNEQRTIEQND